MYQHNPWFKDITVFFSWREQPRSLAETCLVTKAWKVILFTWIKNKVTVAVRAKCSDSLSLWMRPSSNSCHTASQCRGCRWPPASGCRHWALCSSWTVGSLPVTPGPRWPAAGCTDWADRAPRPCTGSPPMHGSHSRTLMVLICLFWLNTWLLISNICMLVFRSIWAGGWWCHKCQTSHHEKQIFQFNDNNYLTMVIKANLLTKNDLFPSHSIFCSCFYLLK